VFRAEASPTANGGFMKVPMRVAWSDGDELQVYHPWALAFRNRTDDAVGVKIVYHEVSPRQ
jgi:hypothetical protein